MAIDLYCERMSEFLSWPAPDLSPANKANNATAYTVGPISAAQFPAADFIRFLGRISVGVLTGAANVTAYLQASNTYNGTYANISSTNATQFINTSNTAAWVECRADQLPASNAFVQMAILVQANSAFIQGELQCVTAHYKPASQFNANTTYFNTPVVY